MNQIRRRVLIVDAEPNAGKAVGEQLEGAGFEVLTAVDEQDGLTTAHSWHPDVIILDLLPAMLRSYEFCLALKQDPRYRHIPIMMLTMEDKELDEELSRRCGTNAEAAKPIRTKILLEQIKSWLPERSPMQGALDVVGTVQADALDR